MKQVFVDGKGEVHLLDVPVPSKIHASILVRTERSLISQGTEGAAISTHGGWRGVYEKAMHSRDRVEQVLGMVRQNGLTATREVVMAKLEDLTALGYSSAGVVEEVSDPDCPFRVGDRVACMGVGFASHAEYAVVPLQLAAKLPDGVDAEHAAFGALACIAMQGIRRLELSAGETIAVIGLGLIGQLAIQIGAALGYRMVGLDLSAEKAKLAAECGALGAWASGDADSASKVRRLTDGQGADGVVICAGARSDEPLNLAFDLCRPRGRVSVVGDVGLGAERAKMYRKELDMRMSCSYGPGRYDAGYEIEGRDYPIAYARWTEGRNLGLYLDLLARGLLHVDRLVSRVFPIADAATAYSAIKTERNLYGVLFSYSAPERAGVASASGARERLLQLRAPAARRTSRGPIRLGLIGCGGFTKAVHLPNIAKLREDFVIEGVASRTGATAGAVAKRTGARVVTSDYRALLDDPAIDAVLVATRHASHGRIAAEALQAGKHIFVEKPLAITVEDCERVVALARENGLAVRVGFNRRFAPLYVRAKEVLAGAAPSMLLYRVNVGDMGQHWSNASDEGGRLLGEGCHFLDLFNWFFGTPPLSCTALVAGELTVQNPNVSFTASYPGGSTATLLYTTVGATRLGKEYLEAFGGGRSLRCNDFDRLEVFGGRDSTSGRRDKGHRGVLADFARAVRGDATPGEGADAEAGLAATAMALSAYTQARALTTSTEGCR
jgi:predicted dehydrogenase/threonine dehydrogenase-like Zn-dependent dehydrogenase